MGQAGYVVATLYPRSWMGAGNSAEFAISSLQRDATRWAAAVRWLRAHADELRLHPDAIAASGFSYQGAVAMSLGWGQRNAATEVHWPRFFWSETQPGPLPYPPAPDPGPVHPEQSGLVSAVAGYIPWFFPELADPGEARTIVHSGVDDLVFPIEETEKICPAAEVVGVTCEFHRYPAGHDADLGPTADQRTARFFHDEMLEPAGLA